MNPYDVNSGFGSFVRKYRRKLVSLPTQYLRDFAFIHINKTGGTSVERALGIPLIHKTAIEYRDDIGAERWARRFRFAVVRNPWDRAVSQFHYRKMINETGLQNSKLAFKEWLRHVYVERSPEYMDEERMFLPQWAWVADEQNERIVDYVGKFEQLQTTWDEICDRLERKRTVLPHVKKSSRKDYRNYYDPESRAIIAEFFREDIERFGYTFEEI
jgi:chondroitin 4-sulfotransferase 11